MQPVLLDASVYITAFRRSDGATLTLRSIGPDSPLWLSAVVLEELYAGAHDHSKKVVQALENDFNRLRRIVVPNLTDWTETGKILARLAARYDYEQIGRNRLTNDALLAMSAARLGIRVMTSNARDFARLCEFRNFKWQVIKF